MRGRFFFFLGRNTFLALPGEIPFDIKWRSPLANARPDLHPLLLYAPTGKSLWFVVWRSRLMAHVRFCVNSPSTCHRNMIPAFCLIFAPPPPPAIFCFFASPDRGDRQK